MRIVKDWQMRFGAMDISEIQFDLKSRDDIPQVLRGLQHIYMNKPVREEIFKLLEGRITPKVNKKNGRPGMELWKIFVLGVLRLDLNWDYDQLHEQVNNHYTIRQMLGHPDIFDKYYYHPQTLKDNVKLLTVELLSEINQIVVKAGHSLVKKKENEALHGRCDTFVVETNVHYPTDINLLFDAMRKVITLTSRLSEKFGMSDWRQSKYNIRVLKRLMRTAQNKKRIKKDPNENLKIKAHREYINVARVYLDKASKTLGTIGLKGHTDMSVEVLKAQIEDFIRHGYRQIDQINRRVIKNEKIEHHEKVFSLFKPYTEWIVKGKAGVPVELGKKVCVIEDQYQFILHHLVMEKQSDEEVAITMIKDTRNRFPELHSSSFDKGFYSQRNQEALSNELGFLVLPKKGKLSKEVQTIEGSKEFRKARHKHSAVESAINALEVHGLDYCPDYGIDGFKRYVALSIVARNIQRIGAILHNRAQKIEKRKRDHHYNKIYQLAA